MGSLSNTIINSREDLDAIADTPDHATFMVMLVGTIYSLHKNDEAKCWEVVTDTTTIERFGFKLKDFAKTPKPELPEWVETSASNPKLVGVEFEGVMCSATRDDQNGVTAVLIASQFQGVEFAPTNFYFSNGNVLKVTKDNVAAFANVWLPFRQSFFAE